jgi:uncharacterized protein YbjQ (UPF0145 family)
MGKVIITGLSGNEMFCLAQKGLTPGNVLIGNSVHSLGLLGSLSSGLRNFAGGESQDITQIISHGREVSLKRLEHEAKTHGADGVTGVASSLRHFQGNIEFLATGSGVHDDKKQYKFFTSSFDGLELFSQIDAGYVPLKYVFGNIAYSVGVGRGIIGALKSMVRGEIREYSDVFNKTRHTALDRLVSEARKAQANVVTGIEIDVLDFNGFHEMLMTGTASHHNLLPANKVATSDLACEELWNITSLGYEPVKLVLGTAVYSLGIVGGITSAFKAFVKGEISELTNMIYEAREHAIDLIEKEAESVGADMVIGTNITVNDLGGGLIEFMAVGTAIRKNPNMKTVSPYLPAQAIITEKSSMRMNSASINFGRQE